MTVYQIILQKAVLVVLFVLSNQNPDPEILITKYNLCNRKNDIIYYELDTTTHYETEQQGKLIYSLQYCSNNENKQWIGYRTQYNSDGTIKQGSSGIVRDIYGEKEGVHLQFYNPEVKSKLPPRAFLVHSTLDTYLHDYQEHPSYGGPLTGQFYGSNRKSIYELLNEASDLKLDDKVTNIIGYDTYLVQADTKYGIVKAWISPDVDYNCLKWEIIKEQIQFYRDGAVTNDRFTDWAAVYEAEKVEQIDGQYVVTQAKFNHTVENGNTVLSNNTYNYVLKNINFNPDYEELGAFEIQLPEGTLVADEDFPAIRYQWLGGKLEPMIDDVVIDAMDSFAEEILNDKNGVAEEETAEYINYTEPNVLENSNPDNYESQLEILSETKFSPYFIIIPISIFIIAIAGWQMYRRFKA